MAEIYSHCPLCYEVDSQQHFFLECRYLKAEERQGSMEQEVREALATFRAGLADRPDLKDMVEMIVSTLNQYVFHRGQAYRLRTLLGRWSEEMQEDLTRELGATQHNTRWQHPAHYGMVKDTLEEVGEVGTHACQELWRMRRDACLQLDSHMATPQADILEHERVHLPRLPHACIPSPTAYEKLMADQKLTQL